MKAKAKTTTGQIELSNPLGINYNYGSPSAVLNYNPINLAVNGYAVVKINCASEPTVTSATKISGATFTADTDMEMVVESKDGTNVRYFFLAL